MIEPTVLLTYVIIVLGFVFIPGPATLLTVTRATSSGAKAGIATGAGIAVGDVIHTLLAVLGLSAIIATSAVLFNVIKYLGAAYLIYLGVKALLAQSSNLAGIKIPPVTPGTAFKQAVYAELLNPKTALFFLSFLPQFVQPENGMVFLQLIILGLIFVALGLISTVVFAVSAGALGDYLRKNPAVVKWQNKVVGLIFVSLGVRLALQEK
ncbi:LysE family translocator [Roseibium porphyridii]|uniref:LysE family translocator n=1 Tax=Roseibium porphyridii TaxID=2866279 RepID=A0ABY8F1V2_9HYPH|nr:LysE family translocator [Roseibium sp. KMA01]WFE87825.1 LysE family translocator [Roseibium sp. KMA01]